MSSTAVTQIKSKTKVAKFLSFQDLFFIIGYLVIAYALRGNVSDVLRLPYIIFSIVMGIFLILPSATNSGRNNLESIYIMLFKDDKTYKAMYFVEAYDERKN